MDKILEAIVYESLLVSVDRSMCQMLGSVRAERRRGYVHASWISRCTNAGLHPKSFKMRASQCFGVCRTGRSNRRRLPAEAPVGSIPMKIIN